MKDVLNVAMLSDKFLPSVKPTSIGVVGYELSEALSQLGVNVVLFCRGLSRSEYQVNPYFSIRSFPHFPALIPVEFLRAMQRSHFDVVHAQTVYTFWGVALARVLSKPVVRHMHGTLDGLVGKTSCELSTCIIAPSNYVKRLYARRFARKTVVVHHGVNIGEFKPEPPSEIGTKYGLPLGSRLILSVGTVVEGKGQIFAVRALQGVAKRFPNVFYALCGRISSQSYFRELQEEAQKRAPGRVKFLQQVPREDLAKLINLAEVCVHPSLEEAFGLAVVEEMSCGKPVVAFNNSAMPEIIEHMRTGILVETEDVSTLAGAIVSVLENRKFANTLGRNAREEITKNFTWQKAAKDLLTVYQGIRADQLDLK